MIWSSIISGGVGSITALAQHVIEKFLEKSSTIQEQAHELAKLQIQNQLTLVLIIGSKALNQTSAEEGAKKEIVTTASIPKLGSIGFPALNTQIPVEDPSELQDIPVSPISRTNSSLGNSSQAQTDNSSVLVDPLASINLDYKYWQFRWAAFLTAVTRPITTFYCLFMVTVISTVALFLNSTLIPSIVEASFITLDYVLAFWFVRRSVEKISTPFDRAAKASIVR